MRKSLAVLSFGASLLGAGQAAAQDHLASREVVQTRLRDATAHRQRDLAVLDRVLSTPVAGSAARALGTDLDSVRSAAASLTDSELRDLAARAAALEADPVAGLDPDVKQLLVIFLIVAIVILVLRAVD